MLFRFFLWTACVLLHRPIASHQELHGELLMKGASDESSGAERRAGEGSANELTSAKARKRDVARLSEEEATTTDIAQEAEKAAVAIAASCAVPPSLRAVVDKPGATAAGGTTVPGFPRWPAPAASNTAEGADLGAAVAAAAAAAADAEDSEDISVDAGGDY